MKKVLLLLMAIVAMAASAATKYEINVAGVEVTNDNANHITGGDITGGYGVYDASSNTLTLYNMTIYRTGQDNYGIHNRKCDNLKIVFSGSCSIRTADNALKLERGTTLNAASGSNTVFYSSARICANLKSYNYYITGSGTMRFEANQSAYEAIKGDGTSSTNVYLRGAKVTAYSKQRSALSSFAAYLQSGTDLTIEGNGSNTSVSSVSMSFSGNVKILEPYGAYYSNNSVYNSSGSQITSGNIYISDNYALIINSTNFPDANFRSALLALYPKGYLTTTQLQNLTSLDVSGKSISSLTGVEKLTYLTTLNCSSNQLTSLPTLPTPLQSLNCADNKFSGTFTLTGRSNLKTFNISNNPSLTMLECCNNALTSLSYLGCTALKTLDCHNNQLSSLPTLPSSLQKLYCGGNQLESLPSLPSGLAYLDCSTNQLTSLILPDNIETLYCENNKFYDFNVLGKTKLRVLSVKNNARLQTLNCFANALETLYYDGCTALMTLNCANNKLTSLGAVPSTVTEFNCSANQLTALPSLPSGLQELECAVNQLNSLSVQGLNSLSRLVIYNNQIKESAMGTLVNSLRTIPAGSTGTFLVLGGSGEGNVITTTQVKTARDKRWIPKEMINGDWVEIPAGAVPGDVDGDGHVGSADITALYNWLLNNDNSALVNGDQNGDGKITSVDVTAVYNILLGD